MLALTGKLKRVQEGRDCSLVTAVEREGLADGWGSTDGGPGLRHRGRTIGIFEACSWRILLSLGSLKGAQRQRGEISLLN